MTKIALMMTRARALLFVCIMALGLGLTACGGKDKKSNLAESSKILNASALEFTAPPKRTVSEEEAARALAGFGLGDGTLADGVERLGTGGNYVYTNTTSKDDTFSLGAFEVIGLHMWGDIPMFDGVIFRDVTTIDEERGVEASIEEMVFMGPSAMLCQVIANSLTERSVIGEDEEIAAYFKAVIAEIDTLDLSAEAREARLVIGFDNFSMSGISINEDGMNVSIEAVALGKTKNGKGAGQIKNVDIKFTEIDGEPQGGLKLGLYEITDFNLEKFAMLANPDFYARSEAGGNEDEIMEIMKAYLDPYNPHYDGYLIKDFSFSMEGLSIDMDQASLVSTRNGGVITRVTALSPLTIKWPEQVADPEMQEIIDAYARMGYDKMVISGGSTSVLSEARDTIDVGEYYVQFDDMFRISGEMKFVGFKMVITKLVTMMTEEGFEELSEDEVSEEFLRVVFEKLINADLEVTFTDLSIIEGLLKYGAEKLTEEGGGDITPAMMKGKAKAGVSMMPMAAQDEAQQKLLGDMAAAFTHMIDESGSVTFDFKPDMPIDVDAVVADIENGKFDVGILGLTISHK